MYKYTIEAYDVQAYLAGCNNNIHQIILKVKTTTTALALQKAQQIATRSKYNIIEIEEL